MEKLLQFLDGKKAVILGIIVTTLSFLVLKNQLDPDTAVYINTVLTILFGGTEIATPRVLGSRRKY